MYTKIVPDLNATPPPPNQKFCCNISVFCFDGLIKKGLLIK